MRISLACNWQKDLLQEIENHPEIKQHVHDLYGAHDFTFAGTGRPFFLMPKTQREKVEGFINQVHDMGLQFTWLWNGECLGYYKFNEEEQSEALKELDWLGDMGVEYLTVSDPYLAEFARHYQPKVNIKVSVISEVNSVSRAREWADLIGNDGVLTLSIMTNRNFLLLKEIRDAVDCDIELLTNDCCLNECPFRFFHYTECSHSSQHYDTLKGYYNDWATMACQYQKSQHPEQVIMCKWIQPNDVPRYLDIGIDYFKISGRRYGTPWLFKALKAYATASYEENLGSIYNAFSFVSDPLQLADAQFPELSLRQDEMGGNSEDMGIMLSIPDFQAILDASKLHDFLANFPFQGERCAENCGVICKYCYKMVPKAYIIENEDQKKAYKDYIKYILDFLHYGDMFIPPDQRERRPPVQKKEEHSIVGYEWTEESKQFLEDVMVIIPEEMRKAAVMGMKFTAERTAETNKKDKVDLPLLISVIVRMVPKQFRRDAHDFLIEKGYDPADYFSKTMLEEIKTLPYGTRLMAEKAGVSFDDQATGKGEKGDVAQEVAMELEIETPGQWKWYLERFMPTFERLARPQFPNLPLPVLFQYKMTDRPEMDFWQLITKDGVSWGMGDYDGKDEYPVVYHKTDFQTVKDVNAGLTNPVEATMKGIYIVEGDTARLMGCVPVLPLNPQAHAEVISSGDVPPSWDEDLEKQGVPAADSNQTRNATRADTEDVDIEDDEDSPVDETGTRSAPRKVKPKKPWEPDAIKLFEDVLVVVKEISPFLVDMARKMTARVIYKISREKVTCEDVVKGYKKAVPPMFKKKLQETLVELGYE